MHPSLIRFAISGLGQDEVNRTHTTMMLAHARVVTATVSLSVATHAQVQLAAQTYHSLTIDKCDWIHSDAAYLGALHTYDEAVTELATAETEQDFATTNYHCSRSSQAQARVPVRGPARARAGVDLRQPEQRAARSGVDASSPHRLCHWTE